MGNLELKAKEYFEKLSVQEYGRMLSWHRIPIYRQVDWMEDIFSFYKFTIENILDSLEEKIDNSRHITSYELGFKQGELHEKQKLRTKLEAMLQALYEELEAKQDVCDKSKD